MEFSKNQLGVKRIKKRSQKSENEFDSKDDYTSTQVSGLKISELESFYFSKVIDLFQSFPLTIHLPNSNIEEKRFGKNTKTMHKGAKNPVFGIVAEFFPLQ